MYEFTSMVADSMNHNIKESINLGKIVNTKTNQIKCKEEKVNIIHKQKRKKKVL